MQQNKYFASIAIALRQQLAQRTKMLGRLLLYPTVIYLFYQVFQSVDAEKTRFWYLAITEWIILSTMPVAFRIAEDIHTGQITYFMLRPMHYLSLRLCECIGGSLVQFIELGILCLTIGYLLTGFIPGSFFSWTVGIVFAVLGIALYTLISVLLGLFSFWVSEIQNIIYLNLTATFSFGGLIVPLSFYSEGFRTFCFSTPYPWILWWPTSFILESPDRVEIDLIQALLGLVTWFLLISAAILLVYQKCINAFVSEGG